MDSADWQYLVDTALLHADLWSGNAKVAPEIRLRLSAFGVSPDARMRLRITIADAASTAPETTVERLQREQREKDQTTRKRRLLKAVTADSKTPDLHPTKENR